MTTAFSQTAFTRPSSMPQLPTLPDGWPIGAYESYEGAQRAVDHLAEHDFPVTDVSIVGVDPLLVERVAGRMSWRRVLSSGAASGAWLGLFVGLVLSMFNPGAGILPIIIGLVGGMGFSLAFSALGYATTRGKRNFVSQSQLVASRYDVLCQPRNAEQGRDLLAKLAMGTDTRR